MDSSQSKGKELVVRQALLELNEILEQAQQLVTQLLVLKGKIDIGRKKFRPVARVKTHARHAHGHHAAILRHGLQGVGQLNFAAVARLDLFQIFPA